jgi:hypothetical protein
VRNERDGCSGTSSSVAGRPTTRLTPVPPAEADRSIVDAETVVALIEAWFDRQG